ncbi:MAG: hypothetical protein ACI841_002009 [Planctomycetota bacterium]|jgi:hypothetical protein
MAREFGREADSPGMNPGCSPLSGSTQLSASAERGDAKRRPHLARVSLSALKWGHSLLCHAPGANTSSTVLAPSIADEVALLH